METKTGVQEFSEQEIEYYLSLVGHKIQILLRKLDTFQSKSYPNPYPLTLIEIMKRILVQSFSELDRLDDRIGEMKNSDIADRAWLIHVFAIRYLSRWMEAIENSHIATTMGGIIDAYNEICNRAQLGTSLIIYPTWQYNFSFQMLSEQLKSIANRINLDKDSHIFDEIYYHYMILTYPYIEDEATLDQVLLAHEVGHFIDYVMKWSEDIQEQSVFSGANWSFNNAIPKKEQSFAIDLSHHIMQAWIREIISDVIAVSMMGPAYVLALGEFMFANPFLQSDSKEIVTSHPPTELRLQLMAQLTNDIQLKASRELDSYESLSNHAKHVYEEVSNIIDIYASQKLPLVTSIHNYQISKNTAEWVFSKLLIGTKNVLEIAKAKLNKLPNKDWLCSSKDVLHALALSESFAHRFIPTKLPKPFDGTLPSFASVMNSGWYYLLTQKTNGDFFFFTADPSKEKKPEVVTESLITMHQLVAKAVEVLNFQRSYQRQRGKNK